MKQFWLGIIFVLASALAHGHHSTLGFFDPDQTIEIDGVITSIAWRNPHIRFGLEVTDDSGESVEWAVESSAFSVLRTRGLDQNFMAVGDRISVAGSPSRRGRPEMNGRNVLLADGTEVLLALSASPHFFDADSGRLLDPVYSTATEEAAILDADGIFRVWSTVLDDPASFPLFKGNYPLTDSALATKAAWNPTSDTLLSCWEKGMPLLMITPVPIEFVRSGDDILIRFEEDDAERLVHMTGNALTESSLLGNSTGRWEGDTLVVETVDIDAPDFDDRGTPQGSMIRLVERFTLNADQDRLDYRILISDPDTFTGPFELTRYWVWRPEIVVQRWDCDSLA
jgi:hypothetical protein